MSDREVEHSELWNTVFASGCVHSDDLNVERKVRADPAVLLSLIVCARCRYPSAKKHLLLSCGSLPNLVAQMSPRLEHTSYSFSCRHHLHHPQLQ